MKDPPEAGLGLIEMIVGLLVSTIVLVAVATVLGNAWLAQEDVTTTSQATTRGQLISSTIERAMRNELDFKIEGTDGNELLVWTTLDTAQQCQAFRLADGEAQMTVSMGPVGASTTWPDWEQAVAQRVVFGTPVDFFAPGVEGVEYRFDIETQSAPVRFDGVASSRKSQSLPGDDNPCW